MLEVFISMPMFVCGIMSVEVLLSWRQRPLPAKLWLLAWSVVATMLYVGHYVYFHRYLTLVPFTDIVYTASNLAVYPLYLIYIYSLTECSAPRWLLWSLAFPVVMGLAVGVLYAIMPTGEVGRFIDDYLYHDQHDWLAGLSALQYALHILAKVAFAVEVTAVVIIGTYRIRKYNGMVEQLYADTEGKALYSVQAILWLLLCTSVISFVVNIVGRAFFTDSPWLVAIPSLLFSVLLFMIGWEGQSQHFSVADIVQDDTDKATEEEVAPFESVLRNRPLTLKDQLSRVMEQEQLYLNPDLKLDDLAKYLGTNRTYLLRTMNDELHMSFSEYVNRQRIAFARQLMEQNPALSKADVALRSGYSSLSSFYRNLKHYT